MNNQPVEWRNRRGRSTWQPRASDGSRLWVSYWTGDHVWKFHDGGTPYLCSRRKAIKLARKEDRRMDREENDEAFEEVKP